MTGFENRLLERVIEICNSSVAPRKLKSEKENANWKNSWEVLKGWMRVSPWKEWHFQWLLSDAMYFCSDKLFSGYSVECEKVSQCNYKRGGSLDYINDEIAKGNLDWIYDAEEPNAGNAIHQKTDIVYQNDKESCLLEIKIANDWRSVGNKNYKTNNIVDLFVEYGTESAAPIYEQENKVVLISDRKEGSMFVDFARMLGNKIGDKKKKMYFLAFLRKKDMQGKNENESIKKIINFIAEYDNYSGKGKKIATRGYDKDKNNNKKIAYVHLWECIPCKINVITENGKKTFDEIKENNSNLLIQGKCHSAFLLELEDVSPS